MSESAAVSLDLIGKIVLEIQAEQRVIRTELRDVRTLVLGQVEQTRRLERRLSDLRDDLELMIKSELMGRLGFFEMQIERRLDALEERIRT